MMSGGSSIDVSVVVPHCGSKESLESCLESLRISQSQTRISAELIIVSNCHPSNVSKIALNDNEYLIESDSRSAYKARNVGISASRGTVIALVDSDVRVSESWLSNGFEAISGQSQIVAGKIDIFPISKSRASFLQSYERLYRLDQAKNVRHGQSATANLFVHASVFRKYGKFRERSATFEDFRWTREVVRQGVPLIFSPATLSFHPPVRSFSDLRRKAQRDSSFADLGLSTKQALQWSGRMWMNKYFSKPSKERLASLEMREIAKAFSFGALVQIYQAACVSRQIAEEVARRLIGSSKNLFSKIETQ